jgi:response regulator RpfG family c-di-GMP phosphodiesterase
LRNFSISLSWLLEVSVDTLNSSSIPTSVLVVDEDPAILILIAKILDTSGMRALLARNGSEAVEIAERHEIPIDLIVANVAIPEPRDPQLLDQLRRIRPGVRDLSMAACVDGGVIRIQLLTGGHGAEPVVCDGGLVESIRKSAKAHRTRHAGPVH